MRVALFSFHTCPLASEEGKESGGMNVYVLNLALELSKQKVFVDVFTRLQDEKSARVVQVNKFFRVIHLKAGKIGDVPKKELINYLDEFTDNYFKFIKGQESYDVFHCHYFLSGLIGLKINSLAPLKTKIVMTFHTLSLLKNLVARNEGEMEDKSRIEAEMKLVKESDIILAPSENERDYLKYFYSADPKKIKIVSPGYDANLFKPMDKKLARQKISADPNHKIVLFVGRIEPLKGLDVLMYAMKILVSQCPDCPICLWIVGGEREQIRSRLLRDEIRKNISNETMEQSNNDARINPELQKLYDLRSTLNLHSSIIFVGQKKQHELPDYYASADVVVMPSHYESFGIAALEAMATGIPVVTTNVTGISYLLDKDHSSLVTSANNPLLLAKTIEKILENEEKNPTLGITIREKVKDLTWTKTAEKIMRIYEELKF